MTVVGTILATVHRATSCRCIAIVADLRARVRQLPGRAHRGEHRAVRSTATPRRRPSGLVPMLSASSSCRPCSPSDQLTIATLGTDLPHRDRGAQHVQMRRVGRRYDIRMLPGRGAPPAPQDQHGLLVRRVGDGRAERRRQDGARRPTASRNDVGLYSAAYKIVQFGLIPVNTWMSVTHNRFLEHDEQRARPAPPALDEVRRRCARRTAWCSPCSASSRRR